jgi:hypothetical protein
MEFASLMSLVVSSLRFIVRLMKPLLIVAIVTWTLYKLITSWLQMRGVKQQKGKFTVGFFHPFWSV